MDVALRRIESEGNFPDDVSAQKSVASSKRGRRGSASYLNPTKSSGTKSAAKKKVGKKGGIGVKKLDDIDLSAVNDDRTRLDPDGLNLDESVPESQPRSNYRSRFFNEELEKKTADLQAQFDELYEALEE